MTTVKCEWGLHRKVTVRELGLENIACEFSHLIHQVGNHDIFKELQMFIIGLLFSISVNRTSAFYYVKWEK